MRSLVRFPLVALLAIAMLIAGCSSDNGLTRETVAASINGVEIRWSQVEDNVVAILERDYGDNELSADERAEILAPLQRTVLSLLIQAQLVAVLAQDQGVDLGEEDFDARFAEEVEAAGGDEGFADRLAGTMLTADLYRKVVVPTDMRLTAIQSLLLEGHPPVELRSARHILVETQDEADDVVAELDGGADFGDLARERSIDPGSGSAGGELGPAARGSFVPEFDQAVWDSPLNTVVGPVQTQFGFHIIEVIGESQRDVSDLNDEQIDQLIGEDLFALITDVLESADVTVAPEIGEWDPVAGSVVAPTTVG